MASGGGFYAYHEANHSFPEWEAYTQMIGLGWRDVSYGTAIVVNPDETLQSIPPGSGESTNHGARVNVLVKRLGAHPIHQGLPASWTAADIEIYRYARGPAANLTVLSYAQERAFGTHPLDPTCRFQLRDLLPDGPDHVTGSFDSIPGRSYRGRVSTDLGGWGDMGTLKAADWPETTTQFQASNTDLPAGSEARLFMKVSMKRSGP